MKKVAIIAAPYLPIPAVRGGAIENLVTLLLEENEKHGRLQMEIYCVDDDRIEYEQGKYKHANIHYGSRNNHIIVRCFRGVKRIVKKIFFHNMIVDSYYKEIYKQCLTNPCDLYLAEGGEYTDFRKFSNVFGKSKVGIHIHHHLLSGKQLQGIFGTSIAVSEYIRSEWIRTNQDEGCKNYLVLNGVDESRFQWRCSQQERERLRLEEGVGSQDVLLIYCGRISEIKGVWELVQAVLGIEQKNIKLLLIGGADFDNGKTSAYYEKIKSIADANKDKIIQMGYISNEKLPRYYSMADIAIVPSTCEEAAPLAAIEAMMMGVPLIVTNSGGMPEYVANSGTVIVKKEAALIENLRREIVMLANDSERRKRMSKQGEACARHYGKETFYHRFVDAIEDMCGNDVDE